MPRDLRTQRVQKDEVSITAQQVHSPVAKKPTTNPMYLMQANSPVVAEPASRGVTPEPMLDSMGSRIQQVVTA